jgi:hypothetical protein
MTRTRGSEVRDPFVNGLIYTVLSIVCVLFFVYKFTAYGLLVGLILLPSFYYNVDPLLSAILIVCALLLAYDPQMALMGLI